jgi:DNA-binding transcriptional ArsR family regulator
VKAYTDPLEALGEPTRRRIFEALLERPRSVQEIADGLPVSRPAVSQHLRTLRAAGLVVDEAVGTRRYYRPNPAGLAALHSEIERFWKKTLESYKQTVKERSQP